MRVGRHEHKRPEVERMLKAGLKISQIAARTGVSDSHIARWRDELRAEAKP